MANIFWLLLLAVIVLCVATMLWMLTISHNLYKANPSSG